MTSNKKNAMTPDSNEQTQNQEAPSAGGTISAPSVPTFAEARHAYATWLASMPADAFAPATHDEVLELYEKGCNPDGPGSKLGQPTLATPKFARSQAGFSAWLSSLTPANYAPSTYAEYLDMWDEHFGLKAVVSAVQDADVVIGSEVDLAVLGQKPWTRLIARSPDGDKELTALHRGGEMPRYLVACSEVDGESKTLYSGYSLAVAVDCYNRGLPRGELPQEPRITIQDLIARSESIPGRKAALDRARVRSALASMQYAALKAMPPEDVVAALCATPAGRAQYEKIVQREPGTPYSALRLDSGLTVEEVVVGLFNTPEGRAEFEEAGNDLRNAMGMPGTGEDLLTSVAKASLYLLRHARQSLADGFESDNEMEADWSKEDKALVARMDDVLANHLAKTLLKGM